MAPFTRSQTPFTFPGLNNHELSTRILLCLLVSFSATTPKWYPIVTRINRRVKREVDCMLQEPAVLQSLTWWDLSETCCLSGALKQQQRWLDRFTERGFSKVTEITVTTKEGDDLGYYILLSGARFPSLQHLRLRGASKRQLQTYLCAFQQHSTSRLTHLTLIDFRFDTRFDPKRTVWPMKITMLGVGCLYEQMITLFFDIPEGVQLEIGMPIRWGEFDQQAVYRDYQNTMLDFYNRSLSIYSMSQG